MAKSEQTIPTGNSRAAAEPFKAKAGKVPPAALIQKKSRDSEEYASSNLDEFTSRLPNGELEMRSMPGFIPNKDHAHLVDPDDPLPASVLNVDDAPKTTHSRAEDPKHQSINLAESLPMTISVKDPIHLPDQGSYFSSLMQCFPGLMMGGGGGLGMVAVVSAIAACCVYVSRKIWKWWKTFDFRESCPYIGRFMLKQGWDSFESFPVVIKIYSISEHREPCRLRIRFRSKVYETKVSTADGKWGSTTRMIVPQGCDRGEIEAVLGHREGRGKVEGTYSFSIWNTMLQQKAVDPKDIDSHPSTFFGQDQHMTLINSQQTRAGNVHITFTLGRNLEDEVPLLQGMNPSSYALADLLKGNIPDDTTIPAKGEFKLQALSNVLRGTLSKGTGSRVESKYFSIIKRETISSKDKEMSIVEARAQGLVKSRWLLAWWNDERHFRSKPTSPTDNLSLLQCTSCRAHPTNPTRFMVRYAANSERHELQLKRVSLERDIWVEGLSLAIAEVHNLKRNPGDKFASRRQTAGEQAAASASDQWSKLSPAERAAYWRKYWADQGYSGAQIEEWVREKSELGSMQQPSSSANESSHRG